MTQFIYFQKLRLFQHQSIKIFAGMMLILTGISVEARESPQYNISETLRSTILEVQNQASSQIPVSGENFGGLDAWVDGTELKWRSTDLSEIEAQRFTFEVKLKNKELINTERDILNMGQTKADIMLSNLLEKRLNYKYSSLIDYIEVKKRENLLQQQRRVVNSELNSWKMKVNSDDFRADKLQQVDLSLDNIWAQEIENRSALNRYQQEVRNHRVSSASEYSATNVISIQQMLGYIEHILQSGAYQHHNVAIRKAELEVGFANKSQQRSYAEEKLALSSVKVEYDYEDDSFGASVGVRIPLTKNSYNSLLEKQDVYYSNIDVENTLVEISEQLKEKQFQLVRLQDQWLSNQKLLHKINTRINRLSRTGNVDLVINLKTERLDYRKRQNDISIRALRQYIGFLNAAGMLSAKPYRNWLQAGTPRIL